MAKSMKAETITVQFRYHDLAHQAFLRNALQVERAVNYGKGMESYFRDVMRPLVEANEHRILLDTDGSRPDFDYEQLANNRKMLTDFVGDRDKSKSGQRDFNVSFLRLVDAFLQLTRPGINSAFKKTISVDDLGQSLGAFLRDQKSMRNPGQQALNVQKALNVKNVIGMYEYDEVDTHLEETGVQRVLVFLRGKSIDYLRVVDFIFDTSSDSTFRDHSNLNSVTGFCVPGKEFSPVLMRSTTYGTRHLGMLYTRGDLVEMSGGSLDDLTFELFTTNTSQLGSANKSGASEQTLLFAQALDIHYGPRLRQDLVPVTNSLAKAKISKIVENLAIDML